MVESGKTGVSPKKETDGKLDTELQIVVIL